MHKAKWFAQGNIASVHKCANRKVLPLVKPKAVWVLRRVCRCSSEASWASARFFVLLLGGLLRILARQRHHLLVGAVLSYKIPPRISTKYTLLKTHTALGLTSGKTSVFSAFSLSV